MTCELQWDCRPSKALSSGQCPPIHWYATCPPYRLKYDMHCCLTALSSFTICSSGKISWLDWLFGTAYFKLWILYGADSAKISLPSNNKIQKSGRPKKEIDWFDLGLLRKKGALKNIQLLWLSFHLEKEQLRLKGLKVFQTLAGVRQ